jgi:hypothetical protein
LTLTLASISPAAWAQPGQGAPAGKADPQDKSAAESPSMLAQASAKWDEGLLTEAEPLYKKALSDGGLFPTDVVLVFSRIGTVQALTKNKDAALSAFRNAALIDPAFQLPGESGPLARKLYEEARKGAAKLGGKLEISAEAPERVDAGKGFTVVAKVPETFTPVIEKIGIEVKDTMGKTIAFKADLPSAESVTFEVPGKHVPGSTTLLVRVSAQDQFGNRWAMQEARVKTREAKVVEAPLVEAPSTDDKSKKGGFFSTPWPYVIGGAVLVAGGVSLFFATRSPSDINVGAPAWR